MTALDWMIVLVLNGAVIGYGFRLARGTRTSSEWFLGSRALPWWAIGLSMFATNVDSADLVSVTGQTYKEGLHIITVYALGSAVGGILAAFWVVPAMARASFYTNAEYLEARFGAAARVLSALIQIQYRSSMLGMMIWSIHILLTELVHLDSQSAWLLIVAMVVFSGCYTAWGGLKSVVWTDAAQSAIMILGAAVIFGSVWHEVGGWSAMLVGLEEQGTADLVHAGKFRTDLGDVPSTADELSPYLVALGWIIIGSGYWTVNHTQTMRLMGARSLWDMKMAAILGVAVSLPIMIACISLGLFGRVLYPGLESVDQVLPRLADDYLSTGLKGLFVAGVVAAALSTFDSMGSALSAVFIRDIYARLLVSNRDDAHYVLASRVATVAILALGFLYLPFIIHQQNMLKAFTTLVPVFVTPLFTIYMLGVFTRAARRSGIVGLICGGIYGVLALYDREIADVAWLEPWFTGQWVALSWSVLWTALSMGIATWVFGPQPKNEPLAIQESGWLGRSRETLPPLREHPFAHRIPVLFRPVWYGILLIVVMTYVTFGLFW